jgi:hypothetical protein
MASLDVDDIIVPYRLWVSYSAIPLAWMISVDIVRALSDPCALWMEYGGRIKLRPGRPDFGGLVCLFLTAALFGGKSAGAPGSDSNVV